MRADLIQLAADLARKGETFVLAVVVRREPASSAQIGNMALVTETGECRGWLGGSCIQPTVVREALAAMQDAAPRLIALSPDASADRGPGMKVFPMTCHSGGSVEIYLEPILAPPRLLIFGISPAAQALAQLGTAMGYAVDASDPEADAAIFPHADRVIVEFHAEEFLKRPPSQRDRLFAVVATLGRLDEEAIRCALATEPAYLGVVASPRRFAQIRETLLDGGVPPDALARITNPAGLDIGAKAPEEVALSILAEIVQIRRAADQRRAKAEQPAVQDERGGAGRPGEWTEPHDPVCGMDVAVTTPLRAQHGGRTYYFCGGGCRERFLAAPERYAVTVGPPYGS